MPTSRTSLDGHVNLENTTPSSGWRCTAIPNEVSLPSGTSSPKHSTIGNAPWSLNTTAAYSDSANKRYCSFLLSGTAMTKPSTSSTMTLLNRLFYWANEQSSRDNTNEILLLFFNAYHQTNYPAHHEQWFYPNSCPYCATCFSRGIRAMCRYARNVF